MSSSRPRNPTWTVPAKTQAAITMRAMRATEVAVMAEKPNVPSHGIPYRRACEEVQRAARLAAAEREVVRWADTGSENYTERIESYADAEEALWEALREMDALRP